MMTAIFLLPAEEEMIAAAQYYQQQSAGLGSEFLSEVERTVAAILAYPEAAPSVKKDIRRGNAFHLGFCIRLPLMKSSLLRSCIFDASLGTGKINSILNKAKLRTFPTPKPIIFCVPFTTLGLQADLPQRR